MSEITKTQASTIEKLYFSLHPEADTTTPTSTATKSAEDENVVKMHVTDKGNLSQRSKIPTALFNAIIAGDDKSLHILSSFPKMKDGKLKLKVTAGPRLAGLSEAYIVEQLTAIQGKDKKKRRKSKYTNTMKLKIKKLTQKDFQDLAAYISNDINPKSGKTKGLKEK